MAMNQTIELVDDCQPAAQSQRVCEYLVTAASAASDAYSNISHSIVFPTISRARCWTHVAD